MANIRHVLLDADGVVQTVPGGWVAAMTPFVGDRAEELLGRAWQAERPMLAGEGDYLPALAALLDEFGVDEPVETVHASVWCNIEPVVETLAIVEQLQTLGYGVHLATNQEGTRAAYMRTRLGYDDLFDVSCYSCDFGVTKPAPAFFVEAAARIGAQPAEVLLVDDGERNVAAAIDAGMAALLWSSDRGRDALVTGLADVGVHLPQ